MHTICNKQWYVFDMHAYVCLYNCSISAGLSLQAFSIQFLPLHQLEPQVRESTQRLLQRIATAKGESVDALRYAVLRHW